jgi:hypothetical protein
LVASALALVAALLVFIDQTILSHDSVAFDLLLLAVAALVLGLAPGHGDWSALRRLVSVAVAVAWLVASVTILVNVIAVSGCACEPGSSPHEPPFALLGIGARYWALFAAAAAPLLLIAAAALPARATITAASS